MALRATIYKAEVSVSDLERNYFADHSLTLALHPSETEERMMVRLLGFVLNADQDTRFGKGLSNEEDAAVWNIDPTGRILKWIDVGLPDETRLKKACSQADAVQVLAYGRNAELWFKQNEAGLSKLNKLTVNHIKTEASAELAKLATRNMSLAFTIQEDMIYVNDLSFKLDTLFSG